MNSHNFPEFSFLLFLLHYLIYKEKENTCTNIDTQYIVTFINKDRYSNKN